MLIYSIVHTQKRKIKIELEKKIATTVMLKYTNIYYFKGVGLKFFR